MHQLLDRIADRVAQWSSLAGIVAAVVMMVSLLLGVFYRYVLQSALPWSGELALLAFTWTVFLIGSVMVRDGGHVRIAMLVERLPRPWDGVLERLIQALVLAFGVVMLWTGWRYALFTVGQVSPAIRYPLWWLNAAVPVSGALIVFHALVLLLTPRQRNESGASDA